MNKKWMMIGGACAGLFLLCCGGVGVMTLIGSKEQKAAQKELAEADASWNAGDRTGAIAKYRTLLGNDLRSRYLKPEDGARVFGRVIDADVEAGDEASAKRLLDEATKRKLKPTVTSVKAQEMVAAVESAEKERAEANKKKEKPQAATPPQDQTGFVSKVESFFGPYKAAPNELKKSALRVERRKALEESFPDRQVRNWVGTLEQMGTTSEGKAHIIVRLAGSKHIKVKTWNNAASDVGNGTLIENGSPLYNSISSQAKGATVVFSGEFLPDGKDYMREGSVTEKGSMMEPEFILRFTAFGTEASTGQAKDNEGQPKLAAFRRVVEKYKSTPGQLASDKEREKYNQELQKIQDEFVGIKFDPAKNRKEAEAIIMLYQKEIEGRYKGEMPRELEIEISQMILNMRNG